MCYQETCIADDDRLMHASETIKAISCMSWKALTWRAH